jgi:4-amino-4-deoxy-L-arabinose transferase
MTEAFNHIPPFANLLLVNWIIMLIAALVLNAYQRASWKWLLFLSACSLAAAFALFSPFLYTWDEQYHALVAKHAAMNPLQPKLYLSNQGNMPQLDWSNSIIWLHKQPLFTWQMALSIKLFGANVFAVRLPAILMHGILTLVVYRSGKLIFNKKTGLIGALIVMHSSYLLGLLSGRIGTDHNDYVFLVYITLSFWAFFEWRNSSDKSWLKWIGIFVGCAVLTKWLVGFLVFFGWGIILIVEFWKKKDLTQFWAIMRSLAFAIGVFLPWQIYTFLRFPEIAKSEMHYNSLHFLDPVEGHDGNWFFHFEQVPSLYFLTPFLLLCLSLGIFFMLKRKIDWSKVTFLLASIFMIYVFFTIAQTKMPSFTIPAIPLVSLVIAYGIGELMAMFKNRFSLQIGTVVATTILIITMLKPLLVLDEYGFIPETDNFNRREIYTKQLHFIKSKDTATDDRIIFGCKVISSSAPSWMFFNDDFAYYDYPTKENLKGLLDKGYEVILLDWNQSVPKELLDDKRAKIVEYKG